MEEYSNSSNNQNTNYFMKDTSKLSKELQKSQSFNPINSNNIQQLQNKNYQIVASDNLKIRLTNNNNSNTNYTINEDSRNHHFQQQPNFAATLFPSLPIPSQISNVVINKQHHQQPQPQLLNQQFSNHQNRPAFNFSNGSNNNVQRTNNSNNVLFSTKNSPYVFQNSRTNSNNNNNSSNSGYDQGFRYNQQYQQHVQQQPFMHHFQQQSTLISTQNNNNNNNNVFQNNSTSSSRHQSLAQSPPAHSHS